jgi:SAM-dependent methyltransferase
MRSISALKKAEHETWRIYFSNFLYAILRRVHPRYREQYRLETLVGPRNVWDKLVQYQFNLLTGLGLKPKHSLLDLGCGPLTVGLRLIPYLDKGNYVGVDLRTQPLIEAYRLIAKHSLAQKNPKLIHSTTFGKDELPSDRTFDYIWMSQLSYHLEDHRMEELFDHARARMKQDSVLLFDVMEPGTVFPEGHKWSGFIFHLRPFEYYAELAARFGFSMTTRGRLGDFGYPEHIHLLKANTILEFRPLPVQELLHSSELSLASAGRGESR